MGHRKHFKKNSTENLSADYDFELGFTKYNEQDFEGALRHLQNARALLSPQDSSLQTGQIFYYLANTLLQLNGEPRLINHYYNQALRAFALNLNDDNHYLLYFNCSQDLIELQLQENNLSSAKQTLSTCLSLIDESRTFSEELKICLGNIYTLASERLTESLDEQIEYLNKAIEFDSTPDKIITLANKEMSAGNISNVESLLLKISKSEIKEDENLVANYHYLLGELYFCLGQYELAKNHLMKAETKYRILNDEATAMAASVGLAICFGKSTNLHDKDKADAYLFATSSYYNAIVQSQNSENIEMARQVIYSWCNKANPTEALSKPASANPLIQLRSVILPQAKLSVLMSIVNEFNPTPSPTAKSLQVSTQADSTSRKNSPPK